MRGQYFSFDAIIATVIMVIAITTLVTYWLGVQSVIESRSAQLYASSIRVADSLMTPGFPNRWQENATAGDWGNVKQIGLASSYSSNILDKKKVEKLQAFAGSGTMGLEYGRIAKIMRVGGFGENYYILIEQSDNQTAGYQYQIGYVYPANASEVVVANRGVVLDGHPARLRVFLWTQ
jgi:hypothetical protein